MSLVLRAFALCALLLARAALAADCPPQPQPFSPELFKQAAATAKDRGFLWSATKDGRTSYLYGTMHVGRAEWMAPGPNLRQALQETELLALEVDVLDPDIQRRVEASIAKVKRVVPMPLQERLKVAWLAECLPPEGLASGPVDMQVMALSVASGRRDGIGPEYASEVLLTLLVRGRGRQVVSLENAEEQIAAMLSLDDAEVVAYLGEALDDLASGKARTSTAKTVAVWDTSDLAELARFEQWCECLNTPAEHKLMKRMLDDRNPGLARGIDELHRQGRKVLAAVGALHMVGPSGLPALLAARGYQVKRIH